MKRYKRRRNKNCSRAARNPTESCVGTGNCKPCGTCLKPCHISTKFLSTSRATAWTGRNKS